TAMQRLLGPNLRGILSGLGLGIIASACSYGAAAAVRGFYRSGADVRSIFAFLISSTNMNVAIVILFWSLLGWKFAFAEFFGGIIIIAIVTAIFSIFFSTARLERLHAEFTDANPAEAASHHDHCHDQGDDDEASVTGLQSLRRVTTWGAIGATAWGDVNMLRTELLIGYLVAGFASALIPPGWLASALHAVGSVPFLGYVLLLITGLLIAVVTFVCSMGNVPIARYLMSAGIPLGANTTFIYGDLLIPPLIAIYRKSFPPQIAWTFVGAFTIAALIAGAVMDALIGNVFGTPAMGSMQTGDRFTLVANVVGIVAVIAVALAVRRTAHTPEAA
ncbi:MAG TPA: permease, partial [Candidatus Acidoferrum sp.]|nr:permease [Candidatus Acidoferrum sp.]